MGCTANIDYNANSHWPISTLLTRKCVVWAPPHLSQSQHEGDRKKLSFVALLTDEVAKMQIRRCTWQKNSSALCSSIPDSQSGSLVQSTPSSARFYSSCPFLLILHWLPSLFRRCVLLSWTTMSQLDPYLDITKTSVKFAVRLDDIDYMSSM